MTTFADVLARRLREEPGQPLITAYDLGTDERVELSVTTYANWVAKAASLLVEEHDLGRGSTLRVDLPTHWLGPVFLGAAWAAGLVVVDADEPDAVVCGPESLPHWAAYADRLPVLACSLRPMGVRFAEPLPAGVHDVGVDVWSQPDAFTPYDPPTGTDPAVSWRGRPLSQDELWGRAAAGASSGGGRRLLSTANPASPSGLAALTEPLGGGGSLVLVSGATTDEAVARVYTAERCTSRFTEAGI